MVKTLLVIDNSTNWFKLFKKCTLPGGEEIKVDQTRWQDIHVESTSEGCVCYLRQSDDPLPFSPQVPIPLFVALIRQIKKEDRIVKPDFLLIRNFPTDLHNVNYRCIVIGLLFAGIPSINSLESVLASMDRPVNYAELAKIKKRVGEDKFPLIPMKYHPNGYLGTKKVLIPNKYPSVIKIGSTHAGFGKMIARTEAEYFDVEGIVALNSDYFTTEPLIDVDYEFRIQKIGNHYRSFRRNSDSSWKGNWGNIKFEDHEWQPQYKFWADECAKMFGGLDIFAIDVLHAKDGKDYIIEVNDTANGLDWSHEEEDLGYIKELVLQKMSLLFSDKEQKN